MGNIIKQMILLCKQRLMFSSLRVKQSTVWIECNGNRVEHHAESLGHQKRYEFKYRHLFLIFRSQREGGYSGFQLSNKRKLYSYRAKLKNKLFTYVTFFLWNPTNMLKSSCCIRGNKYAHSWKKLKYSRQSLHLDIIFIEVVV